MLAPDKLVKDAFCIVLKWIKFVFIPVATFPLDFISYCCTQHTGLYFSSSRKLRARVPMYPLNAALCMTYSDITLGLQGLLAVSIQSQGDEVTRWTVLRCLRRYSPGQRCTWSALSRSRER